MTVMIPAWVNGTLTPMEKLEAHQRGQKHQAISVFVIHQGKVLIQQRALGKYHTPGLWANTCCTHPHWGEEPAVCANRRLDEELGINGLHLVHRDRIEYRADVGNGLIEHEVVDLFTADAPLDLPLDLNPDEVMATKWVDFHALAADVSQNPKAYTPWLRIYLREHAFAIFGDLARAD